MKYFIDTEFIEGFHKPLFGKKRHFIDLISIGIVCEDGRKYYAISNEYDYSDADKWVKDNVIHPVYLHLVAPHKRQYVPIEKFHKSYGKSNIQIAEEIKDFINPKIKDLIYTFTRHDCWAEQYYPKEFEYIKTHNTNIPDTYYKSGVDGSGYKKNEALIYNQPEFYAYYADYDWVLFCSLFGRMIDLPKGFPMYCNDLKQTLDYKAKSRMVADQTFDDQLRTLKEFAPKQSANDEHNALEDAKWNFELYKFLQTI